MIAIVIMLPKSLLNTMKGVVVPSCRSDPNAGFTTTLYFVIIPFVTRGGIQLMLTLFFGSTSEFRLRMAISLGGSGSM